MTKFTEFFSDDAGAVAIDWLALSAIVVLLAVMVVYSLFNNGVSKMVPTVTTALSGENKTVVLGEIEITQ